MEQTETLPALTNAPYGGPPVRPQIDGHRVEAILAARMPTVPEDVAADVLERLGNGETLTAIGHSIGISHGAMRFRLQQSEIMRAAFARARISQAAALADKIILLAWRAIDEPKNSNGIRVAIEAIKWSCATIDPQRYGQQPQIGITADQVSVTIAGLDQSKPQV